MVVLWERGGYMDVLTLEDRMEHNDNTKDTKLTILKAQARGGVIAVKQYSSPNLVLLSYPTDPNMETFIETTDSTDDAMFTEDGKYVVVRTGVSGDHTITAYDFKSGKELGSITCASYDLAVMGHDHDFFVYHQGGKDLLEKYEISDKGLELVGSMEDVRANNDNAFNLVTYSFLGYGYGGYTVIDLDTMKVSFQDDQINIHCAATGGENGNTIAFISDENVVHVKNGKTNSETLIREDSMKAILGYEGGNNLAVSPDGNYIALLCLDNQVRIYDMSKEMIIAEVPLGGRSFCFLHFTPDSQHLLMQGNDYYLHVYDIEKGAMVQDNSAQMYHISEVEYLENDKGEVEKIALHAGSVMYLLTPDTYEVTAHIINGCDISLRNDIILCAKYKAVVTFPYYTLDELYEIAEEQTGGERLSPEKRVQLNVD
jgi:WD40 repeat protein